MTTARARGTATARLPAGPPSLADGRVRLRALVGSDVPAIVRAAADPGTLRFTQVPPAYTDADGRAFVDRCREVWAAGREAVWATTAPPADDWLGSVSLRLDRDDPGLADVGFLCAPWARGRGVTTAALRQVCAWGFGERGLARIEWRAHVGNGASRRVAEKVGFRLEGVQRARLPHRGERRDAWVAALLPEDLR